VVRVRVRALNSTLLVQKAKDMSRVEIPITQFQTTQIKTAKVTVLPFRLVAGAEWWLTTQPQQDMKNRYDKLRIQVEATNKQRVVEANLDQAFQHMTESTVYKLREVLNRFLAPIPCALTRQSVQCCLLTWRRLRRASSSRSRTCAATW
jgi:hypothetical protein